MAERSSPAAAQRCANGAGLDGIAHGRSTIIRAVEHGRLFHWRQAADRHANYTSNYTNLTDAITLQR